MPRSPERLEQQKAEREWVESILASAQSREWFGTITIEMKRGRIHLLVNRETLKPPPSCAGVGT